MILDQQTYDRLNTIEATIKSLVKAVIFLDNTVFPQVTVDPIEVTELEGESLNTEGTVEEELILLATKAADVRKDKTNGPSKEKPKAKKKTVRKTS